MPLKHMADRVEIGCGQGRQALAVQVLEPMSKCGRVDFTVYPWRGDDESAWQSAANMRRWRVGRQAGCAVQDPVPW